MSESRRSPLRRFLRVRSLVVVVAMAAVVAFALARVGSFLSAETPVEKADAIFVFSGTLAERPLEAVDLYQAGYAPTIVLTRDAREPALEELERRGIVLPVQFDLLRDALRRLNIPDQAVIVPDRIHDNTAQEAGTLRGLAASRGWKRVILVSSKYHMRRVGMASRRALRGTGVVIYLRASRYDESAPNEWWRHRGDIRRILWEVPKLVGYTLGVGE